MVHAKSEEPTTTVNNVKITGDMPDAQRPAVFTVTVSNQNLLTLSRLDKILGISPIRK